MDLRIRAATTDDLDRVVPLFDAYRQFYGQLPDPRGARDFLFERIERRESVVVIVERGEAVLGFAQLYPMFSSVRMAAIWVLNDLYVAADERRNGIGTLLLDAASAAARAAGATRLVLETGRDNAAARALYRSAGWNEEDTQWYALDLCDLPALN
ncbi:MAG: GNAT family N-acetyltransferase [Pseudomonas sp.]|nr:GNAT family N-acetyltransferase [Pseudomonas sp.]